jgi:hypothetical protein
MQCNVNFGYHLSFFSEKPRETLIELFVERNPYRISFAKINRLMFFREVIACYSEIHMKHNNTVSEKNLDIFFNVTEVVHLVSTLL